MIEKKKKETYYSRNRENRLKKQKIYNSNHKEEIKAYFRSYYLKNKTTIYMKRCSKKKQEKNKENKPKRKYKKKEAEYIPLTIEYGKFIINFND